jgi:hypothetical protein
MKDVSQTIYKEEKGPTSIDVGAGPIMYITAMEINLYLSNCEA